MTNANLSLIFESTSTKKVVILKAFFFFSCQKILKELDDDSNCLCWVNSNLENEIRETIEKFENDKGRKFAFLGINGGIGTEHNLFINFSG